MVIAALLHVCMVAELQGLLILVVNLSVFTIDQVQLWCQFSHVLSSDGHC